MKLSNENLKTHAKFAQLMIDDEATIINCGNPTDLDQLIDWLNETEMNYASEYPGIENIDSGILHLVFTLQLNTEELG